MHVGVFLIHPPAELALIRLPHARGGVSNQVDELTKKE